jgi:ATP-dependent Clp protease adaptor protein ClpS
MIDQDKCQIGYRGEPDQIEPDPGFVADPMLHHGRSGPEWRQHSESDTMETDQWEPGQDGVTRGQNAPDKGADTPPGGGAGGGNGDDGSNTGVVIKARVKTRKPAMYKVLMLNDDYTPMEFVVHVLERFFQKNREEATQIMLHVHRRGVGVCGVFTYEVAESKVTQVMDLARQNQHPLQCTIEKE